MRHMFDMILLVWCQQFHSGLSSFRFVLDIFLFSLCMSLGTSTLGKIFCLCCVEFMF